MREKSHLFISQPTSENNIDFKSLSIRRPPLIYPFYRMSSSGNKMVCKILLLYGADIRLQDADGHTPLYYINDPHMVQMIQCESISPHSNTSIVTGLLL